MFLFDLLKQDELIPGRIIEILSDLSMNSPIVVLDIFQVMSTRHDIFDMPRLALRMSEHTHLIVPATVSTLK